MGLFMSIVGTAFHITHRFLARGREMKESKRGYRKENS
jgi:hypothetical protein